uniref:Uncharacterized protein n=1 Tax=Trichogramma kaykai TaxID=54128 RepID=A0ABD2WBG2_9HYME
MLMIDRNDNPGEVFLDFVVNTGYKDEPEIDEDGKPLFRRSTAVHRGSEEEDQLSTMRDLREFFKIYDRFDVNYTNECGLTHFHVACEFGFDDVVKKFLELGQDPNCLSQESVDIDPPLNMALANHHDTVARLLLESGANPNLANLNGWTPLHIICKRSENLSDYDDDYAEIFFKINDDVNQTVQINAQDKSGNTPLHMALEYGLVVTSETLLRRGADPNITNAEGLTPLHVICKRDYNDDLVEAFFKINDELQQTVQVDVKDEMGRTPLQYATSNILPNVIEFLLDHGADLSGFVFPSENDFDETCEAWHWEISSYFNLKLASGALACVERLEKKRYEMDRSDALTIMNVLVNKKVFEMPLDLDESWYDDERFAGRAAKMEIRKNLTLYDFVRSPPEKATKLLLYMEYFEFGNFDYSVCHYKELFEASTAHLCEILSRRFFQRWAMDPLMELTRYRLPILCCEMIIKQLNNEDLRNVCLATANQSS